MSNNKNSQFYALTIHDTVPASALKTGTIRTIGINVIGTGTLFLSEVKPFDWIVDITNDEIRKVVTRRDDTYLAIDSPFTSDIAAGHDVRVVRSRAKEISVSNEGAANGEVDNQVFLRGASLTFSKSSKTPNGSDFIDPILVDATGTTIMVSILK